MVWKNNNTSVRNRYVVGTNLQSLEILTDYSKLVNRYWLVGGSVSGVTYKRSISDATSIANTASDNAAAGAADAIKLKTAVLTTTGKGPPKPAP